MIGMQVAQLEIKESCGTNTDKQLHYEIIGPTFNSASLRTRTARVFGDEFVTKFGDQFDDTYGTKKGDHQIW